MGYYSIVVWDRPDWSVLSTTHSLKVVLKQCLVTIRHEVLDEMNPNVNHILSLYIISFRAG